MYSTLLTLALLLLGSQINILTFALPFNPNLNIAHKWTANQTQSPSSTTQSSSCSDDKIYLKNLPNGQDPGCYPKIFKIFQSCLRNEQCQTDKSYCGYHEVNDFLEHVCVCNQGYAESWDNSTCEPYRECTLTDDFNNRYLQADCAQNQFCRKGSCHCKPNYQYNRAGKCVWDVPDVSEPGAIESPDFWTILGGWLDLLWVKVVLVIMFAFGIFVPIVLLVLCKRLKREDQQQNTAVICKNSQNQASVNTKLDDERKRLTQTKYDDDEDEEEDRKTNDQL